MRAIFITFGIMLAICAGFIPFLYLIGPFIVVGRIMAHGG